MRFLILSSILLEVGPAPGFANLAFFLGPCEGRERRDSIGIATEEDAYLRLFDPGKLAWIRRQELGQ